jgi:NADH-quinone oxidoreductase subunit E
LRPGPTMVENRKVAWPADLTVGPDGLGNSPEHIAKIMSGSMEALIHHFKLVTEGIRVPAGQVYVAVESPRGELGVHMVSDGGTRPYRVHYRDPSFTNLQAVAGHVRGRDGRRRDHLGRQYRSGHGRGGPMTAPQTPGAGSNGERVFIRLGPPPEEPGQFVTEGAPESYPAEVQARLEVEAKEIIGRYPNPRSALLPLLHLVQSEDGYVTPAGVEFCAEQLGLTGAEVAAVASFYTMYRRGPTGEYLVGVCTNTLCAVMGGDAIFDSLKEHLGIGNDETTSDGSVTLQHIECNAACDYAPVVMVNWEFFDNQTAESARELVDGLRSGQRPVAPTRGPRRLCTWQGDRPASWPVSPTRRPPTKVRAGPVLPRWPGCAWPGNTTWPRRRPDSPTAEGHRNGLALTPLAPVLSRALGRARVVDAGDLPAPQRRLPRAAEGPEPWGPTQSSRP